MRAMTRAEQRQALEIIRYLRQKLDRYIVSHSPLAETTAKRKMHDTQALASAMSEADDFVKSFNQRDSIVTRLQRVARMWGFGNG